ncbi:DUF2505 domain-containing protein [Nocardioides limicola]|uniref:DUF2505 domain-containing protein n=1 Tax=Nocardioides limicola TaxID=2803368 RepID=UPI00193BCEEB|nr:DUF2505 domain-containing protein [Nocardioides sp. DJM-14]
MATRFTVEVRYDAPTARVREMLTTAAFRAEVCDRQHALRHDVAVDGDRVRVEQVQAADGVPSFAKKLVGSEITIIHTETWVSATEAEVRVEIPDKPGNISGRLSLLESAGATTQSVHLDISARIPLVGSKIEGLIAKLLEKAYAREHEVGQEWLARP